MKKIYIEPYTEVFSMNSVDGILVSASNAGEGFDTTVGGGNGKGEDLGREDNTPNRPNLWEQGW